MKGKTKAQKSVACQKSRECGQYGTWQPCVFLPDSKTVPGLGGAVYLHSSKTTPPAPKIPVSEIFLPGLSGGGRGWLTRGQTPFD